MKKYTTLYLPYVQRYFIDLLAIQLFVTLISLPILIAWGIPLSLFSIIGNIFFSPFLTAYILLSSLIFAGAFFNITCMPLMWLLDRLTTLWITLLNYCPSTAYIGFVKPSIPVLILLAILTLSILHTKHFSKYKKCSLYALLLLSMILCSELYKRTQRAFINIPCFNGSIHLLINNNTSILIDPGYIGQRISAPSWAEYTFIAELIKHTGRTHIDHAIILQPTIFTFNALEVLCRKISLRTVYIPLWSGEQERKWYGPFTAFKKAADMHGCTIVRFGENQEISIDVPSSTILSTHNRPNITKNGICFANAHITGIIDNKAFSFYASLCKKLKNTCTQ